MTMRQIRTLGYTGRQLEDIRTQLGHFGTTGTCYDFPRVRSSSQDTFDTLGYTGRPLEHIRTELGHVINVRTLEK